MNKYLIGILIFGSSFLPSFSGTGIMGVVGIFIRFMAMLSFFPGNKTKVWHEFNKGIEVPKEDMEKPMENVYILAVSGQLLVDSLIYNLGTITQLLNKSVTIESFFFSHWILSLWLISLILIVMNTIVSMFESIANHRSAFEVVALIISIVIIGACIYYAFSPEPIDSKFAILVPIIISALTLIHDSTHG